MKLGIRPEFVCLHEKPEPAALDALVTNIEDLGSYKIVTVELAGETIKARIEEDDWVPADRVYMSFPLPWLKLYADEYLVKAV
ncbi:MAG: TOBE domain-containing protein [Arenicella sp.]|nr:TOBE domain-containing protein [Arenicella sp.]